MPTTFKEYSTTALSNTDVGSSASNIEEGCAIKNFNNALRQVMADTIQRFGNSGTIASAATTSIGTIEQEYVTVTGTTTITSLGTATNKVGYWLRFAGILTLTNGANLILPGGANITTAAGDVGYFKYEGSSVWRCLSFQRASNQPGPVQSGRLIKITDFSSSGSFVKNAATVFAIAEVQGGGAAGGGIGVRAVGEAAAAGCGQNGAYIKYYILAALMAASCPITIGAGGTGASGADGGDGGDTVFDSDTGIVVTAGGGDGGKAMSGGTSVALARGGFAGGTVSYNTSGTSAYPLEIANAKEAAPGVRLSASVVIPSRMLNPGPAFFVDSFTYPAGLGFEGRSDTSDGAAVAGQNGYQGFVRIWEYS